MTLEFPCRTYSITNEAVHHMVKWRRAKLQKDITWAEWRSKVKAKPELPCTVTFTRISPRMLDVGDNLNSSMKHVRDQVAKELGVDDNDSRITWVYSQEKGKEFRVRIEIQSI